MVRGEAIVDLDVEFDAVAQPIVVPDDLFVSHRVVVTDDLHRDAGGVRRRVVRTPLKGGLFVLTGVTYVTAFLATVLIRLRVLPLPAQDPFRLVVRVLQFVGLVFNAYSLYIRE